MRLNPLRVFVIVISTIVALIAIVATALIPYPWTLAGKLGLIAVIVGVWGVVVGASVFVDD